MSIGSQRQGKHQPKGQWITKERRLGIYLRDEMHCAYCGCDLHHAAPADITLDHLTCKCDGGGNESANLVTACRSCNSARGAKGWRDYATGGAIERIERLIQRPVDIALAKALIAGKTGGDAR